MAELANKLRADARLTGASVLLPHPAILSVRQGEHLVLVANSSAWQEQRKIFRPFADDFGEARASLVLMGSLPQPALDEALLRGLSAMVSLQPSSDEVYVAIHNAFQLVNANQRAERRGQWVNRYRFEIGEFVEIAQAITTEKKIDKLLALILAKSRFITNADAGSLYVVEGDDPDISRRTLRFKLSQNDSIGFDSSEFSMPINEASMAGYVALNRSSLSIEDVYNLAADSPYSFDHSFDEKVGYRTKSMLCAPMMSPGGEVIGVLQLINAKKDSASKLIDAAGDSSQIRPFDERSQALLSALAALAGVSLENAFLNEENEHMLEGFVRASVDAIEQRDPTTSGHSIRVADMTIALAEAVSRQDVGIYADVHLTQADIRELEYASLLHDFGKIGVREEVLIKAKKLYPHELKAIRMRVELALRSLEVHLLQKKIELIQTGAGASDLAALEQTFAARQAQLLEAIKVIEQTNEPELLRGGDFAAIEAIAKQVYIDSDGHQQAILNQAEVEQLCIPRGSLTAAEYDEIRSHVTHTIDFLKAIPWGRKFRRVAQIAGAHHERLDGTGYPNRLRASEIPLQSKMMSITDIFDALTAADRPYKRAIPTDRALDILHLEVKHHHVDGELVRIFVASQSWSSPPSQRF
jgi:HD-GYP domain-containing protein (c-di-GMP phosphodiesterase class II)